LIKQKSKSPSAASRDKPAQLEKAPIRLLAPFPRWERARNKNFSRLAFEKKLKGRFY
jgi:hypothetical protein